MGMSSTAKSYSRPSLQSKHGLSSCFKGPHGPLSSEPTSVLDLATISPASSPGSSPKDVNPGMSAPSLHKSIIHRSYHKQNSSNSLHEANSSPEFPQSNACEDHHIASSHSTSSPFRTSSNGGCASPSSCEGLSFGAQNEILQVMESLDDLEFVTNPQIYTLEDVLTENVPPFPVEGEHNPWDVSAFDLLTSDKFIDVQDSLSCLDDTLSFNAEDRATHDSMYLSPDNSLEISHFQYPLDRIETPYSCADVAENNESPHAFRTLTKINPPRNQYCPLVPKSISDMSIHTLQECRCVNHRCRVENQPYYTNSGHICTSEVQGSPSNSQFSNNEELMGSTSSLEYSIDRQAMDNITCGMRQSISSENVWIDSSLMPEVEEFTSARVKQGMQISTQYQEEQGLQLVHLLLLCGEMISEHKYNIVHSLLRKLQMMSSCSGNPLERIAFYFSEILLKTVDDIIPTNDFVESMHIRDNPAFSMCSNSHEQMEIDAFYLASYQALPYTKFLHFTANQAILEAVENSPQIHVIDFDIQQGMQWPNFFQALVGRALGPPELIKLSAIGSCIRRLNQTGRMLSEFAESLSLNFIFCPIVIRDVKELNVGMFSTKRHQDDDSGHHDHVYDDDNSFADEAIALNLPAILDSHLWEGVTTDAFLMLVKKLHPRVISIMKAEKHNEAPSFVHKFIEVLFYYSAFFDSLEVAMDRKSLERARIERISLRYGLKSIVSDTGGRELAMEASMEKWQETMKTAGFYSTQFSDHAIYQAKLLLTLYFSEAFRIEGSRTTSALSINWKETPLFIVMVFSPAAPEHFS